jgi:hypothetical protein
VKSKYKSGKSVAKNPTVPISADDPRVAWDKLSNTKSRQGAEIDVVGLDGKSLIAGGTTPGNQSGATSNSATDTTTARKSVYVPSIAGRPPTRVRDGYITPTAVTNAAATWSGEDLIVTFDWDYTNALNKLVSHFILELTVDGVTERTPLTSFVPNRTGTAQTVTVTKTININTFGVFRTNISAICVITIDPYYNESSKVCVTSIPEYVLSLPVPVITVTSISNGYSVAYTTPTEDVYDAIEIVEYESTSTTEPTGVTYVRSYFGTLNPSVVITPNYNARWVKARFTSDAGNATLYSAAQKITPTSPVSVDNTPPNEVTQTSASWSGDNIIISYKLPAQDQAVRVQIQLTAPNSLVGYFYRFPDGSGRDQTTTITKKDLFDQFGEHYPSFTAVLKSIDAVDNKSAGVSFNVPSRNNPLEGITPTFTTIPLSNAYSVNFTMPTGAVFAEVYAKHTAWVGDPIDDTYVVYAGLSPAVVIDTDYTTVYIKIRYYDDFGNTSNYSAEGTITPLNPGEITEFENPITFGSNAVIYAGNSATEGTRTLFKTGGIFAYDATNTSPSTQIVSNASAGTPTFITTQAQIADWNITETKIENTLSGAPTKYTGLSATGTYAFWAGSDVSGGNSSADFTVTPSGTVTARNISIIGNGSGSSNLISAGGLFSVKNDGTLTATGATLTGTLYATGGEFTGNVKLNGGSLYALGSGGTVSTGIRTIFNSSGVAAFNANGGYAQMLTTPLADGSVFATTAANIGGWKVSTSVIEKTSGNANISLDSANGYIYVSNSNVAGNKAGINSPSTLNDVVFWAGSGTLPADTINNFRVTLGGKLYATNADISGEIKAESGYIGDAVNGWTIDGEGIVASGTGRIGIGNYHLTSVYGTDFSIYDTVNDQTILTTDTVVGFARIYLGQEGRQIEVAKNAEISGSYSGSEQDYRSGGLRNMYTITQSQYNSGVFPSAPKGAVLLVYDPSSTE